MADAIRQHSTIRRADVCARNHGLPAPSREPICREPTVFYTFDLTDIAPERLPPGRAKVAFLRSLVAQLRAI